MDRAQGCPALPQALQLVGLAPVAVVCPSPAFAWHHSSWLGLCLPHVSLLAPFHPLYSEQSLMALQAKRLWPWDSVSCVTLLHTRPCSWMYVYIYL